MKKVVFLDRDGTLIVEPPDEQIDSLEKLELIPGVITGLKLLLDRSFELVMVSNQDGLGTPDFPREKFEQPQQKLLKLLQGEGVQFSAIFLCSHRKEDQCECRKPNLGLVKDYLQRSEIDKSKSFVIGDRETDVEFGERMRCRTIRLTAEKQARAEYATPDFLDACCYIVRTDRSAETHRHTQETNIVAQVYLDGTGEHKIRTGIGFFDHMLAQLARHSLIDMTIRVSGDLHIDEHHTIEDTGMVLGKAVRQALGNKRGIGRYGFVLPMDESLAHCALDLSDRPLLVFEAEFSRERVGDLPTELVEDFFRAFSDGLRANLHLSVKGRNDHHKIEALFKSTARSLKQAVSLDAQTNNILPTTKGIL